VGNRLSRGSTLASLGNQNWTYGADDRLTSDTYDANGNTTVGHFSSGLATTDAYDFEDRLVSRNNGQVAIVSDGDGNRVRKAVGGMTTHYLVDDLNPTGYAQVLEELTSTGGAAAVTHVYGYGHDLLSQDQVIGTNWQTHFYGYDGHSSVRSLTDGAGNVTDTYDYDAFGNVIAQTGSTPNNYLYSGEQFDAHLGLYYLRARYHNPDTGRFWTRDRFGGFLGDPASLHQYAYSGNDPVNGADPSGYATLTERLVVAGIAGGLSAYTTYRHNGNQWGWNVAAYGTIGAFGGYWLAGVPAQAWTTPAGKWAASFLLAWGGTGAYMEYKAGYPDLAVANLGLTAYGAIGFRTLYLENFSFYLEPQTIGATSPTSPSPKGVPPSGEPPIGNPVEPLGPSSAAPAAPVAPTSPNVASIGPGPSPVDPIPTAANSGATFGRAASTDYRATFFAANPELEGQVVVHHAVERQTLTRFPDVVSEAEIHSLENLRGVPKAINSDVHLSQIRREWNQFYRQNPAPTRDQLLEKATQIDAKYGSQFQPPR
jgi:RHS repeat-associated protein